MEAGSSLVIGAWSLVILSPVCFSKDCREDPAELVGFYPEHPGGVGFVRRGCDNHPQVVFCFPGLSSADANPVFEFLLGPRFVGFA